MSERSHHDQSLLRNFSCNSTSIADRLTIYGSKRIANILRDKGKLTEEECEEICHPSNTDSKAANTLVHYIRKKGSPSTIQIVHDLLRNELQQGNVADFIIPSVQEESRRTKREENTFSSSGNGTSFPTLPKEQVTKTVSSASYRHRQKYFEFGKWSPMSDGVMLPCVCYNFALTEDGCLLLATDRGLIELCAANGREVSHWRPPAQSNGKIDEVQCVAALSDGRVAVGLFYAQLVVVLRRSESDSCRGPNTRWDTWTVDLRFDRLPWPPFRLSTHLDVLAVTESTKFAEDARMGHAFQSGYLETGRLRLMSMSSGQQLIAESCREYFILSMAITNCLVVTGGLPGGLSLMQQWRNVLRWRKPKFVLDAHSLKGDNSRLWRRELNFGDIPKSICIDSIGGCLYAAMLIGSVGDFRMFSSRVSVHSLANGDELQQVVLDYNGRESWRLPYWLSLNVDGAVQQGPQQEQSMTHSRVQLAVLWYISDRDDYRQVSAKVSVHGACDFTERGKVS